MNEVETRAELIDPALKEAGWGVVDESKVLRERNCRITEGRLLGAGKRAAPEIADYILAHRNTKLAVIEAKKRDAPATLGVAQAKQYAGKLRTRYAYSTNGDEIYRIDMETGAEGTVDRYPTPEELWDATYAEENAWRDRFAAIPFEDKGGFWQPRYYQDLAIGYTLEAIAAGRDRILLTLATGTGKTAIAFQIAWKLFHAKWNLSGEPTRRPRILFLADRNILANQAFNSFSAFDDDALLRISPDEVRKKGGVPKNGSVFFTIFQTFMSGADYTTGEPKPNFGDYPEDFFDFIIIDECHRGGAKDESNWRGILEYFSPAVQLGLTATPLRKHNADTYEYFGEPLDPEEPKPRGPGPETGGGVEPGGEGGGEDPPPRPKMLRVKLADGNVRAIQHMVRTSFWGPDGKPLSSEEFLEQLFGDLPDFFDSEEKLREIWSHPDTRGKLLQGLAERGYSDKQLQEIAKLIRGENSDLYDVLSYVAYARDLVTREERVVEHKDLIFSHYDDKQQAFIDFVLGQYVRQGVGELDSKRLPDLIDLKYQSIHDATGELGEVSGIREMFVGFQKHLFAEGA